jgi:phosphatidylserine decarboxylase precursor-related protein
MHPLLIALIIILAIIIALLLFWRVWFLRQPKRAVPKSGIVSPASGRLVRIITFKNGKAQDVPKGLLGRVRAVTKDVASEGQMLVIMLTPFDVHYQRAPADAIVEKVTYTKGLFRNAVIGADRLSAF